MPPIARFLLLFSIVAWAAPTVRAELLKSPPPGSVYREFSRVMTSNTRDWRVTHPKASFVGNPSPGKFLPNPNVAFTVGQLDGATRAEAVVDVWGGHVGTSAKRFRFNNHAWLSIPDLENTPTRPECYMHQFSATIDVPLDDLVEGANIFQGDAGPQICYNFNWGQWGWYSFTLRVYLDPATKAAHPTGSIVSQASGDVLGENPTIRAEVGPGVERVEYFGYYEDFDGDGDGVFTQWHHNYQRAFSATRPDTQGHIGTATAAPWSVVWDTTSVPTQKWRGIKLMARIKGTDGTWYVTDEVDNLSLQRPGSVRLYAASKVPERFWVRDKQKKSCEIQIPTGHNLAQATRAQLWIRSWNGIDGAAGPGQSHYTRLNSWDTPNYGANHYYNMNTIPVPLSILKNGTNTFSTYSESSHHGIEIMWPGPALTVHYGVSNGTCGDAYLDWGEECDDGDAEDGNGCSNDCREQSCGDGQIGGDEECDDGNTVPGDDCDENCVIETCGNGVTQTDEACDDGNTNDTDGCGNDCTDNYCGDDELNNGEQCEDGGAVDGDGCDRNCRTEVCGNGFKQIDEQCDDGNTNDLDACGNDCTRNYCGDGEVNNGEQCDDANSDDDDGCRNTCRVPGCRDGRLDPGEACDDGNTNDLDGCSNDCVENFCGDGETNNDEQCDDGNDVDEDLCTNACLLPVVCDNLLTNGEFDVNTSGWSFYTDGSGNASVVGGELRLQVSTTGSNVQLYQSGVALEGSSTYRLRFRGRSSAGADAEVWLQRHVSPYTSYGLRTTVDLTSTMRDHVLTFQGPSTAQSDGRFALQLGKFDVANSTYHFDSFLLERVDECPYCGDGLVGLGEQCDDANQIDDDACGNDCRLPCTGECGNVCGDGVVYGAEACDDGNTIGGDGCAADCTAEGCGDGVTGSGEACDDGNVENGDGCSSSCAAEYCGDGVVQPGLGEECDGDAAPDWHGGARNYRVPLQAGANGYPRAGAVAEQALNLQALLASAGGAGTVQASSLKLVEVDADGKIVDGNVPFQFDGTGAGNLIWIVTGNTALNGTRRYQLYFDVTSFDAPAFGDRVGVTDGVQHGGQASFKIESATGVYYFQKEAAGLSGLIDITGRDWITYSGAPGTAGEYRGIPNMVYPGGIYHPGFFTAGSELIHDGPLRVTVESPSDNGQFRTRWEFFPDFARMTVLKATGNYWFLYEGTPGGLLDRTAPNNDFLVRSDGTKYSVGNTWGSQGTDIPGDEWVYFSDPALDRSLFLVHHTNDSLVDWYQPLDLPSGGPASDWMTVFGFGRGSSASSHLGGAPRQFTIGLIETTQFATARDAINSAYKPLSVSAGVPEQQTFTGDCSDECRIAVCGDGTRDATEECDDGGTDNGDDCDAECRLEVCGNGVVQAGEECDDGNTDDLDACSNDCTSNYCGDGEVNNGEQCDDGNAIDGDGCDGDCLVEACGNGVVQAGEGCDDGNTDDLDACGNDCVANTCGDGVTNNGEQCDDGNTDDFDLCSNACRLPFVCDNGITNADFGAGEADWTFYTNGSGVFSTATGEARIKITVQGSNVQLFQSGVALSGATRYRLRMRARSSTGADVEVMLQKHGSPYSSYGLRTTFDLTTEFEEYVVVFTATPGNKSDGRLMLQFGRFDSTNPVYDFDDFRLEKLDECPFCGDGEVGLGEICDDGNAIDDDTCSNTCRVPCAGGCVVEVCGDGAVGAGEACDDGNDVDDDACGNDCVANTCGDGETNNGEACDDGNDVDDDACGNDCVANVCGDGEVNNGELCDDGNDTDDDECSNSCVPPATCDSAIANGDFAAGASRWNFYSDGSASFGAAGGAALIQINTGGNNVQLYQSSVALQGATTYRLSLRARNSTGADLEVALLKHGAPYSLYGLRTIFDLNEDWGQFTTVFRTPSGDRADGRLMLQMGKFDVPGSSYTFDDIRLEKVGACPLCGDGVVTGSEQCDDGNGIDSDACANDCRLP